MQKNEQLRRTFGRPTPGFGAPEIPRVTAVLVTVALLLAQPVIAFQSPLSEEAIREAYFLGQRRDESMANFLTRYTRLLPAPTYGPHIASLTTYTPFAQAVVDSSRHAANYSAQQAQLDHRHVTEMVQVLVTIRFTDSYGPMVPAESPSSHARSVLMVRRSSDFWHDFSVSVFSEDKPLEPSDYDGHPDYNCHEGGCFLVGATIQLEFLAESFPSQDITVEVDPPEFQSVAADFDLGLLR